MARPRTGHSKSEKELDKLEDQFNAFDKNVKELTLDRMNKAPLEQPKEENKISVKEARSAKEIWLKPKRSLGPGVDPKTGKKEQFNERFRKDWEFAKEYVQFRAYNKECIGEPIQDIWTKPFPGINTESWDVPTGKPIWGPRYLAEQIRRKRYHRLVMEETSTPGNQIGGDVAGQYYGKMVADTTVQRLDAEPVIEQRSVFMGESSFK